MAGIPTARSPVSMPGPKGRRPWSTELLREWASVKYQTAALWEQVRLGPTSASVRGVQIPAALERMLRVENWYADGVIVLPDSVLIIEAKIKANPSAVGQVLFYQRLAIATPELQQVLQLPLVAVVLFAEDDAAVRNFATQLGCRVEIYTPPWIAAYMTQVQFRARSTAPSIPPEPTE